MYLDLNFVPRGARHLRQHNENTDFQKQLCGKKCIIISELTASFWEGWQAELI